VAWWRRREPASSASAAPAEAGGAEGSAAGTGPTGVARSGAGWQALPPVQRAIGSVELTAPAAGFTPALSSWQNPSFLGALGHTVDPAAPAGLVTGLATPVPAGGRSELPLAWARPAGGGSGETGAGAAAGAGVEPGAGAAVPAVQRAVESGGSSAGEPGPGAGSAGSAEPAAPAPPELVWAAPVVRPSLTSAGPVDLPARPLPAVQRDAEPAPGPTDAGPVGPGEPVDAGVGPLLAAEPTVSRLVADPTGDDPAAGAAGPMPGSAGAEMPALPVWSAFAGAAPAPGPASDGPRPTRMRGRLGAPLTEVPPTAQREPASPPPPPLGVVATAAAETGPTPAGGVPGSAQVQRSAGDAARPTLGEPGSGAEPPAGAGLTRLPAGAEPLGAVQRSVHNEPVGPGLPTSAVQSAATGSGPGSPPGPPAELPAGPAGPDGWGGGEWPALAGPAADPAADPAAVQRSGDLPGGAEPVAGWSGTERPTLAGTAIGPSAAAVAESAAGGVGAQRPALPGPAAPAGGSAVQRSVRDVPAPGSAGWSGGERSAGAGPAGEAAAPRSGDLPGVAGSAGGAAVQRSGDVPAAGSAGQAGPAAGPSGGERPTLAGPAGELAVQRFGDLPGAAGPAAGGVGARPALAGPAASAGDAAVRRSVGDLPAVAGHAGQTAGWSGGDGPVTAGPTDEPPAVQRSAGAEPAGDAAPAGGAERAGGGDPAGGAAGPGDRGGFRPTLAERAAAQGGDVGMPTLGGPAGPAVQRAAGDGGGPAAGLSPMAQRSTGDVAGPMTGGSAGAPAPVPPAGASGQPAPGETATDPGAVRPTLGGEPAVQRSTGARPAGDGPAPGGASASGGPPGGGAPGADPAGHRPAGDAAAQTMAIQRSASDGAPVPGASPAGHADYAGTAPARPTLGSEPLAPGRGPGDGNPAGGPVSGGGLPAPVQRATGVDQEPGGPGPGPSRPPGATPVQRDTGPLGMAGPRAGAIAPAGSVAAGPSVPTPAGPSHVDGFGPGSLAAAGSAPLLGVGVPASLAGAGTPAGAQGAAGGQLDLSLAPAVQRLPAGPPPTGPLPAAPLLGAGDRAPTALLAADPTTAPAAGTGGSAPAPRSPAPAVQRTGAPMPPAAGALAVQRSTQAPTPVPDAGSVAVDAGLAHREPDGTVVFRQVADPAPAAAAPPSTVDIPVQRAEPSAAPAADGQGGGNQDLDALAGRLYERLLGRLKAELRLDRERAGMLTDLRR
jgi:syndecan 1